MALAGLLESGLRAWSKVAPSERGSYRMVRAVRGRLPELRRHDWFDIPGVGRMRLDLSVYPDCCMAFGLYELTTLRLIRRRLRLGDTVIDGGANIGYFTLLAARCVGDTGRVHAVEPEPGNRARLQEHLKENGLAGRVTVHPVALSDHEGEATIHRPHGQGGVNHGCASLFLDPAQAQASTAVPTARLDELAIADPPRLIKLDLEGAEALAIDGAEALLTADRPPMIVGEVNPAQAHAADNATDDWLRRALAIQPRYRVYRIGMRLRPVRMAHGGPTMPRQENILLAAD